LGGGRYRAASCSKPQLDSFAKRRTSCHTGISSCLSNINPRDTTATRADCGGVDYNTHLDNTHLPATPDPTCFKLGSTQSSCKRSRFDNGIPESLASSSNHKMGFDRQNGKLKECGRSESILSLRGDSSQKRPRPLDETRSRKRMPSDRYAFDIIRLLDGMGDSSGRIRR